ncbi:MAG: hypothetical protein HY519_01040 [Candidatus Aenigmarchaeota archaeon]|nr:hypothetical protein [Candidatus Aenigmarchaeota archaeon]
MKAVTDNLDIKIKRLNIITAASSVLLLGLIAFGVITEGGDWLITVSFLAAGLIVYLGARAYGNARKTKNLQKLASLLGLTMKHDNFFSEPDMTGTYGKRPVEVGIYPRAYGMNSIVFVACQNPYHIDFSIYSEGLLQKTLKKAGTQDVKVGHDLDERFIFKIKPTAHAARIFKREVLTKLSIIADNIGCTSDNGGVTVYTDSIASDAAYLRKLLDLACALADALES